MGLTQIDKLKFVLWPEGFLFQILKKGTFFIRVNLNQIF